MGRVIEILNKILFYGFLVVGFVYLFFDLSNRYLIIIAFGSFFASWLLAWVIKRRGLHSKYEIFINIALWLNVLGEIIFYYHNSEYYDKFLHFSVSLLMTVLIYEYYSKSPKIKKDMVFFTILGMLSLWEIYEYIVMVFFGIPTQGIVRKGGFVQSPIDDTMMDLIYGAIGSIVYLIFKIEFLGIKKLLRFFEV